MRRKQKNKKIIGLAIVLLLLISGTVLVTKTPIRTDTKDVIIITTRIVPIIFPRRLGFFILAIVVVMVRKIIGTMTTNIILINKSPNGFKTLVFSLKITPTIPPIIIANSKIIDCL